MTNQVAEALNIENLTKLPQNRECVRLHTVKKGTVQLPTIKNTATCKHCKGVYRRDKLWRHLKYYCSEFQKKQTKPLKTIEALKKHSKVTEPFPGASQDLINEVLPTMRKDERYVAAAMDPLIMEFASEFQVSRRGEKDRSYISRQCRDLGGLLVELKKVDPTITNLDVALSPKYFETLISVIKTMSKFDPKTGRITILSLPYRLLPAIKGVTLMAKDNALQRSYKQHGTITAEFDLQIKTYDDFYGQLTNRWNEKIGKLTVNSKKGQMITIKKKISLQEDIVSVCNYIVSKYRQLIEKLNISNDKDLVYDELLSNLVTHCMCLMRRRPVAFKLATLDDYQMISKTNDVEDMALQAGLSKEDVKRCSKFSIFYVQSKNGEVVPIALTKIMKKALDTLVENRSAIGITGNFLFSTSKSKIINPGYCLMKIKSHVKLKFSDNLTPNGLRRHAATFSKLHSSHPRYEDYLAGSMGHTLLVHKKNYELPQSILQKLIVVPTLHRLTVNQAEPSSHVIHLSDEGNEYEGDKEKEVEKGECSDEASDEAGKEENEKGSIHDEEEKGEYSAEASDEANKEDNEEGSIYDEEENSEEEDSEEGVIEMKGRRKIYHIKTKVRAKTIRRLSDKRGIVVKEDSTPKGKKPRWSKKQRQLVFKEFGEELLAGKCPPRNKVMIFYNKYKHILQRNENVVFTFLHNIARGKQKVYTPDRLCYKK